MERGVSKTLLSESTLTASLCQAEQVFAFLNSGRRQGQLLDKYITATVFVFSNFLFIDK